MSSNPVKIDPVQQYLNQMQEDLKEADAYISRIEHDATKIAHDQTEEAYWAHTFPWWWRGGTDHPYFKTEVQKYKQDEDAQRNDIKQAEAGLQKLGYQFSNLDATINSFLASIRGMAGAEVGEQRLTDDVAFLLKNLSSFFDAMKAKAKDETYEMILDSSESDNFSDAQMEQLATEEISAGNQEQGILNHMVSDMSAALMSYQKIYDQAHIDHESYSWLDRIFGNGDADREEDDHIMVNAEGMMISIDNIMGSLIPEMSSIMPEFTEDLVILNKLIKKVMKILEDVKLPASQKGEALRQLMFFALGLLTRIQAEVQGEKAKNQTDMSKANLEASKMNMESALTNSKIQEEQYKVAQANKIFMKVLEVVAGAIMTLMSGGAAAVLMAGLTVAEATGAIDKLTQVLANTKLGKIGADIMVGALEIVLTAGGGAIADQLIQKIAQASVKAAMQTAEVATKEVVEQAVKEVAQQAAKEGVEQFPGEAEFLAKNIIQKAMDRAAFNCVKQFQKISIPRLIEMAAKGTLKETLQSAVTEAAELAAKDLSDSVAIGATIADIEKGATSTITRSSDSAVASATHQSEKTIEKQAAKSAGKIALGRAAFTAIYYSMSINMLTKMLKAMGVSEDNGFMTFMQIIQTLIQMVVLMAGTGMMSQVMSEGSGTLMSWVSRIQNATQTAAQGSEAIVGLNQSSVQNSEGQIVKALQMDRAVADLLHSFLEQLQKDMNLERDRFTKEEQNEFQSQFQLSTHLQDGQRAGIEVLVSAAG